MGLELAQKGNITCNAICPGYVLTDLIRNQLKDTAKARGIPEASRTFSLSTIAVPRVDQCLVISSLPYTLCTLLGAKVALIRFTLLP